MHSVVSFILEHCVCMIPNISYILASLDYLHLRHFTFSPKDEMSFLQVLKS